MQMILSITAGITGGFISMRLQSLFISRRDRYLNSPFSILLRKASWWLGGFIVAAGMTYKFLSGK